MNITRREFIAGAVGSVAVGSTLLSPMVSKAASSAVPTSIRAVAFDAFPVLDPRAAFAVIEEHFPGHGDNLRKEWFARIFSYTWLRTAGNRYRDFRSVMEDALYFSTAKLKLPLTSDTRDTLLNAFQTLPVWEDVKPALAELKGMGIRLAFLSNMTEAMLRSNMQHNGIEEYFDFVLSTDRVNAFKPHPRAYQLAVDAFSLPKESIAFAAFAGWDAAGASWYGYPTVWVNRLGAPREELDSRGVVNGKNMSSLVGFVKKHALSERR